MCFSANCSIRAIAKHRDFNEVNAVDTPEPLVGQDLKMWVGNLKDGLRFPFGFPLNPPKRVPSEKHRPTWA